MSDENKLYFPDQMVMQYFEVLQDAGFLKLTVWVNVVDCMVTRIGELFWRTRF